MDTIKCYAPTNDSDEHVKEEFYSRLLTIIQDRPRRNIIIEMRDFNAKIVGNNRGYEEIKGQQGLGEVNGNGERFAIICATGNLVTGGNFFQHLRIHKATWVSPDLQTENQIDHMYIRKKFRRTHQAWGGCCFGINHHLIVRLKLKLSITVQHHKASQGKHLPGTLREKGREADQETCGAMSWRKT